MTELTLPQKFKKRLEAFTRGLRDIYKEGLISVILYGSAASGEFSDKSSNINLAIILDDAGLSNLTKAAKIVRDRRFRLFNPVFFTEDYIKTSSDVFPIEFLDIKENHAVLYGKDVFEDLNIDIKNLTFQCEQELKARLLNMKRLYLRARDKGALKGLLMRSFTSAMHILRNLVRIKGRTPSYAKEDVLKEVAKEFQIDTTVLSKILEAKIQNTRLSYKETGQLFTGLVMALEKITGIVDKL